MLRTSLKVGSMRGSIFASVASSGSLWGDGQAGEQGAAAGVERTASGVTRACCRSVLCIVRHGKQQWDAQCIAAAALQQRWG